MRLFIHPCYALVVALLAVVFLTSCYNDAVQVPPNRMECDSPCGSHAEGLTEGRCAAFPKVERDALEAFAPIYKRTADELCTLVGDLTIQVMHDSSNGSFPDPGDSSVRIMGVYYPVTRYIIVADIPLSDSAYSHELAHALDDRFFAPGIRLSQHPYWKERGIFDALNKLTLKWAKEGTL